MNDGMIRFTVRWNINTYKPRMKEIRRRIVMMLKLAQADFSAVNEVLRTYTGIRLHPDMASRVSDGIKFLQYMDTLTQKLNHIIELNQALMNAHPSVPFLDDSSHEDPAEFIFRLNYFQAWIAHNEFLSTVSIVKDLIDELNKTHPLEDLVAFSGRGIFRNLRQEEINTTYLFQALFSVYTERQGEQRKGVIPASLAAQIANIYTMNSERLVLEWLQNNPEDDPNELMRTYSHSGFGQEEEQVEFF